VAISREQVRHIAQLARLALTEQEVTQFTKQLGTILAYVDQITEVDVEGVEGTAHAVPLDGPFRDDIARDAGVRDEVLAAAPRQEEGLFVVPKIV
jgi:aspartyl-tRNA(Asn)/glutamyl-tRNA(Gln) amidotransferase subunit C